MPKGDNICICLWPTQHLSDFTNRQKDGSYLHKTNFFICFILFSAYGVGYEWNPQVLKIRAGDTVNWEWAVPTYVVGIKYTVQQTADSDSVTYDGTGFYAGAATNIGK